MKNQKSRRYFTEDDILNPKGAKRLWLNPLTNNYEEVVEIIPTGTIDERRMSEDPENDIFDKEILEGE